MIHLPLGAVLALAVDLLAHDDGEGLHDLLHIVAGEANLWSFLLLGWVADLPQGGLP